MMSGTDDDTPRPVSVLPRLSRSTAKFLKKARLSTASEMHAAAGHFEREPEAIHLPEA